VTAWAPGRVNLIGEHLDYNGGLCLPLALQLGTTTTVGPLPGREVAIISGERRWSGSLDDRPRGWPAYVIGVLASLGVEQGLAIVIESDLPIGAGLSSSAALECSIALGVDQLLDLRLTRDQLAAVCVRAENDFVGLPTGGMDQDAVLFCEPRNALLLDFARRTRTFVPFDPSPDGLSLLVVNTGVTHHLASSEYAARRAECASAAAALGREYLASATYDDLYKLSSEVERRRARHVVTEQLRVLAFVSAAAGCDWTEVGHLMTASHLSLRDDYEVSCPELDVVVASAIAAGALGARMTGAGFGGSAVVLTPTAELDQVGARIELGFARNGWDAPTQIRVEASPTATVLRTGAAT
jgi:galactokinase